MIASKEDASTVARTSTLVLLFASNSTILSRPASTSEKLSRLKITGRPSVGNDRGDVMEAGLGANFYTLVSLTYTIRRSRDRPD